MGGPKPKVLDMPNINKRLTTPGAYGAPYSGTGQLLKTQDQFAKASEAGDTGAQIDLMDKARSQATTNLANQQAQWAKANADAQSQAGLDQPPPQMGPSGGYPMGGQFYKPRRRR